MSVVQADAAEAQLLTSFLRKGPILRKKCGAVKACEIYSNNSEPKFVVCAGQVSVRVISNLSLIRSSVQTTENNLQNIEVLCPSCTSVELALQFCISETTDSKPGVVVIFLQSALHKFFENVDVRTQRRFKESLFDERGLPRFIFLDMICRIPVTTTMATDDVHQPALGANNQSVREVLEWRGYEALSYLCKHEDEVRSMKILVNGASDPLCHMFSYYGNNNNNIMMMEKIDMSELLPKQSSWEISPLSPTLSPSSLLPVASSQLMLDKHTTTATTATKTTMNYPPHVSPLEIERGLKSGLYVMGEIKMYRGNPFEAEVVVVGASPSLGLNNNNYYNNVTPGTSTGGNNYVVLISGRADINRALHGDMVAIKLHDHDKWSVAKETVRLLSPSINQDATSDHLEEEEDGEEDGVEVTEKSANKISDTSNSSINNNNNKSVDVGLSSREKDALAVLGVGVMPTGHVAGIIRRQTLEILATVPISRDLRYQHHNNGNGNNPVVPSSSSLSSSLSSVTGAEEAVLIVPLDRRLPKFRMLTRQRATLAGQRVMVRFDSWPRDSFYPNSHLVECFGGTTLTTVGVGVGVGSALDWKAEVQALLIQHNLRPRDFSLSALACLPPLPTLSESMTLLETENKAEEIGGDRKRMGNDNNNNNNINTSGGTDRSDNNEWMGCGWQPATHQLLHRLDLRSSSQHRRRHIFSVDPPGCQDIDDTMSVRWIDIEAGELELTVNIADVCAFVELGSALDREAQDRATTVYLPHRRYDMLPSILSSDIASLHCNKDRLAVTVMWHIHVHRVDGTPFTPEDNMLELDRDIEFSFPESPYWMGRTVIKSVASMTYYQAHNLIFNGTPTSGNITTNSTITGTTNSTSTIPTVPLGEAGGEIPVELWPDLRHDLRLLMAMSRALKRRRISAGALEISQAEGAELKFTLNEEGIPSTVQGHEELEIHDTIAELMILANSAVARYLETVTPAEALIRIHPPVSRDNLKDAKQFLINTLSGDTEAASLVKSSAGLQEQLRAFRESLSRQKKFKKNNNKNNNKNDKNEEGDDDKTNEILGFVASSVIKAMNEARYVCAGSMTGVLLFTTAGQVESSSTTNISASNTSSISGANNANSTSTAMTITSNINDEAATRGQYSGHYGLGLSHYTHFTSPIRRYADVLVHRQLLLALQSYPDPTQRPGSSSSSSHLTSSSSLSFVNTTSSLSSSSIVVAAPQDHNNNNNNNNLTSHHHHRPTRILHGIYNEAVVPQSLLPGLFSDEVGDNNLIPKEEENSAVYITDKNNNNEKDKLSSDMNALTILPPVEDAAHSLLDNGGSGGNGVDLNDLLDDLLAVPTSNTTDTIIIGVSDNATTNTSLPNNKLGNTLAPPPSSTSPSISSSSFFTQEDIVDPLALLDDLLDGAKVKVNLSSSYSPPVDTFADSVDDLLDGLLAETTTTTPATTTGGGRNGEQCLAPIEEVALPFPHSTTQTMTEISAGRHMDITNNNNSNNINAESDMSRIINHPNEKITEAAVPTLSTAVAQQRRRNKFGVDIPYTAAEVVAIAAHLNDRNRRAKRVQYECQRLFLNLYFRDRVETRAGVIYGIRENGFLVYIASLDFKGPVYIENKNGVVCMRPSLLRAHHHHHDPDTASKAVDQGRRRHFPAKDKSIEGRDLEQEGHVEDEEEEEEFPDYECVLQLADGTDDRQSVLTVRPKSIVHNSNEDGDKADKSLPNKTQIQFAVMDRVLVSVTASPPRQSSTEKRSQQQAPSSYPYTPEIRLSLVQIDNQRDSTSTTTTATTIAATTTTTHKQKRKAKAISISTHQNIVNEVAKVEGRENAKRNLASADDGIETLPSSSSVMSHNKEVEGVTAKAKAKEGSTFYQLLESHIPRTRRGLLLSRLLPSRSATTACDDSSTTNSEVHKTKNNGTTSERTMKQKVLPSLDGVRYAVPKSGRLFFGAPTSSSSSSFILPPLFKESVPSSGTAVANVGTSRKSTITKTTIATKSVQEDAATARLGTGLAAAKARMTGWGEEWAEEEDLPGFAYPESSSLDHTTTSGSNNNTGSSDYALSRKELSQVTARIGKLKVAKKDSKYK